MINYETISSPFFEKNKAFTESLEKSLKDLNATYSGFCNSYGYEVSATFPRNTLNFQVKFYKNQSTQNGVVIPVDAKDQVGSLFTVSGLNKKSSIHIGKSSFRRLFTLKEYKSKLPNPYFINSIASIDKKSMDQLIQIILDHNISKFKLNHGVLKIEIHNTTLNPQLLISDIERVIHQWV